MNFYSVGKSIFIFLWKNHSNPSQYFFGPAGSKNKKKAQLIFPLSLACFSPLGLISPCFSLWASSLHVGMRQAQLMCSSSCFGAKNKKRQSRESNLGLGVGNQAPYHCVALLFVLLLITIAYYIMVTWFYNEEQICNSSFFFLI